jgi:hypothetical protein
MVRQRFEDENDGGRDNLETLAYSPLRNLMQLLAPEYFIQFTCCETFQLYIRNLSARSTLGLKLNSSLIGSNNVGVMATERRCVNVKPILLGQGAALSEFRINQLCVEQLHKRTSQREI